MTVLRRGKLFSANGFIHVSPNNLLRAAERRIHRLQNIFLVFKLTILSRITATMALS